MSKPKLTPWYPAEVKPVRAGIYERNMGEYCAGRYSYFDPNTGLWYGWAEWVLFAIDNYHKGYVSSLQDRPWRGLTEKAK